MSIRIGLAGAGFLSRAALLPALDGLDEFEVAAVLDPDPDVRRVVAGVVPGAVVTGDEEAFFGVDLDAVHVATPNHLHASIACRALADNLAVVVDKPLAGTVADALEIHRNAEKSTAPLLVGYMSRYNANNEAVRRLVADGAIGVPLAMSATHLGHRTGDWRNYRAYSGLGCAADLAIYPLLTAGDVFDSPATGCQAVAYPSGDPELTDIYLDATVWFGDRRLHVESSFTEAPEVGVSRYSVVGSGGVLVAVDTWAMNGDGSVLLCDDHGRRLVTVPSVDPYARQYRLLAECMAGRPVPAEVGSARGLRDVAVLHQLDRSAATGGQRLAIPDLEPPWTS
ncbi:Gfo/Idh/MocA family oxidoreductase [Plantactinospora sp. S1510]|uniref:Gfo/Idh/MocA family oxidoreductase n=1 Tax=Plantactinospora alkalitolerans TaxID=2789879 RepID=A0ABS0GTY2_9ACTN|nr:Gfo/Idh/MocA family oxidoreductase [Plantactinospora alkalitolerans]MBF9129663.1 Gfo/Idh/MocA family oxidoreductase [Plantactinospora alkalitolerans]